MNDLKSKIQLCKIDQKNGRTLQHNCSIRTQGFHSTRGTPGVMSLELHLVNGVSRGSSNTTTPLPTGAIALPRRRLKIMNIAWSRRRGQHSGGRLRSSSEIRYEARTPGTHGCKNSYQPSKIDWVSPELSISGAVKLLAAMGYLPKTYISGKDV